MFAYHNPDFFFNYIFFKPAPQGEGGALMIGGSPWRLAVGVVESGV